MNACVPTPGGPVSLSLHVDDDGLWSTGPMCLVPEHCRVTEISALRHQCQEWSLRTVTVRCDRSKPCTPAGQASDGSLGHLYYISSCFWTPRPCSIHRISPCRSPKYPKDNLCPEKAALTRTDDWRRWMEQSSCLDLNHRCHSL